MATVTLPFPGGAEAVKPDSPRHAQAFDLLKVWCEGMLPRVIDAKADRTRHGALDCPACNRIHGRCGDAVLPFLEMAARTGDARWRGAALGLLDWMPVLDCPDGAWTNEPDPASWKGITVFTAIMLAECVQHHADLLGNERVAHLRKRLDRAGDFIAKTIRIGYGNINYPASAAHALLLLGRLLDRPDWIARSRELAAEVMALLTPRDHLLPGEGAAPDFRSPQGRIAMDLAYNVGESLPSLTFHALLENDRRMMDSLMEAWKSHLEFMLPDGAWDNSWGTRAYKWTWWGGRTAETGLPAMMQVVARAPEFGSAIDAQLKLLKSCTHDGLLHGGPHYRSHGVPPCIHHSFVMAKSLATFLHQPPATESAPLPRATANGIRSFSDLGVHLAACGPWRATFSCNDVVGKAAVEPPSGGVMSLLWHRKAGPLLVSTPVMRGPIEPHNMQPWAGDPRKPLTCRIEAYDSAGEWFTNLHDHLAGFQADQSGEERVLRTLVDLLDANGKPPPGADHSFDFTYQIRPDGVKLSIVPHGPLSVAWRFVLPIVSPSGEPARQEGPHRFVIEKPGGRVEIESTSTIRIDPGVKDRLFHPVPGMETIPLWIERGESLEIRIRFIES